MPRYDFAHPSFKNGYPTFKEKEPDLLEELARKLIAFRFEFIRSRMVFRHNGEIAITVMPFGYNTYKLKLEWCDDYCMLLNINDINKIVYRIKNDMR